VGTRPSDVVSQPGFFAGRWWPPMNVSCRRIWLSRRRERRSTSYARPAVRRQIDHGQQWVDSASSSDRTADVPRSSAVDRDGRTVERPVWRMGLFGRPSPCSSTRPASPPTPKPSAAASCCGSSRTSLTHPRVRHGFLRLHCGECGYDKQAARAAQVADRRSRRKPCAPSDTPADSTATPSRRVRIAKPTASAAHETSGSCVASTPTLSANCRNKNPRSWPPQRCPREMLVHTCGPTVGPTY